MTDTLIWSAVVAVATIAVVWGMDAAARHRSAGFRHAMWAGAMASLALTPGLLAVAAWAASRPGVASIPAPSWTPAEPAAASGVPWLVVAWAIPAALLAARSVVGWILAAGIARRATPVGDHGWREEAAASARRLGLTRTPPLAVAEGIPGPAVVGILRPVVLMPPSALNAPATVRRAILDHELAHVGRGDVLLTRVSALARALHWYNPLVWWSGTRLDLTAECACDERVVRGGVSVGEYARILAQAVGAPPATPLLAGAGFGTAPVVKRLEALVSRRHRAPAPRDRWFFVAAMVLALAPLAVASATLVGRQDDEQVLVLPEGATFTFAEGGGPAVGVRRE